MKPVFTLAVLGNPIVHSRSPAIHKEALRLAGLSGSSTAIRADVSRLRQAIAEMHDETLSGINVTMPLKGEAASLAEFKTPEASLTMSVNTLRVNGGVLEGHSTDATAFQSVLGESRFAELSTVLLLGTGGAARAAMPSLGNRRVYVSSRDLTNATEFALSYNNVEPIGLGTAVAGSLVINATPIGMDGESLPGPILEACRGLIDLPYGGSPTPAARTVSADGLPLVDGYEFLARQAAESFRWWTGVVVDFESLAAVARKA
jgi:shikimate dehydrogenase